MSSETNTTKVCLLINGAIRLTDEDFKEVIENYKRLFQSVPNLDIWFYTWSNTPRSGAEHIAPWDPPTVDEIKTVVEPMVTRFIARKLSPTEQELDSIQLPGFGHQQKHPHRLSCYSNMAGTSDCFSLFEEEGIKYDIVAKGRNDCVFNYSNQAALAECIEIIKNNPTYYITPPNFWSKGRGINDHFAIATYDLMKSVWSIEPTESLLQEFGTSHNPETLVQNRVAKFGGTAREIPGSVSSYYLINKGGNKLGKWVLV